MADTLHFARAAGQLHITQSALSRAIGVLESKLGVSLFIRSTHEVSLSPAGESLLEDARSLLAGGNRLMMHARSLAGDDLGELSVSYVSYAEAITWELLVSFVKIRPGVLLNHRRDFHKHILADVSNRRLDLGVVFTEPVVPPNIAATPFGDELRFVGVVGTGHPLAGRERVTVDELVHFPFAWVSALEGQRPTSDGGIMARVLGPEFVALGLQPTWVDIVDPVDMPDQPGSWCSVVRGSPEWVWLQPDILPLDGDMDLRAVEIDPPLHCSFQLVNHVDNDSPALHEILTHAAAPVGPAELASRA